jgi:hypothetical protein
MASTDARPRGVAIGDLVDLATAEGDSASDHLARIYDWQFQRSMTLSRAFAGTGFANLIAGAIAIADKKSTVDQEVLWWLFAGSGLLLLASLVVFLRGRRLQREFVAAQYLLAELQRMRPFLRLLRFGQP